jgi:NifB/MoaA-like Fe-S oxidoreductase
MSLSPLRPEHSRETIELRSPPSATECVKKYGSRIFFCGDEMYIKAGMELPPDEFYEEHTQLENGVGMIRLMETEFNSALRLSDGCDGKPFSIACGVSAAPYFEKLLCVPPGKNMIC